MAVASRGVTSLSVLLPTFSGNTGMVCRGIGRWRSSSLRILSRHTRTTLQYPGLGFACHAEACEGVGGAGEHSLTHGGVLTLNERHPKVDAEKASKTKQYSRTLGLNTVASVADERNSFAVGSVETGGAAAKSRWFPHKDEFQVTDASTVSSGEVLEILDHLLSDERKQRMETVVANRTFSVCPVVEGLSDVGNVSAICRTADAMGFQSIHVISCNKSLRYRENHRTSAGAEKWLELERWDDTQSCIETLKARGYRIAATHIAEDTVSIHDMDWTVPTAIILGNEHRGISDEALALSDVRCSIPMAGMVESFNVSVAAAIVMHHAAMDRISRVGYHGDLSEGERSILLAVFYMRHRHDTKIILKELLNRKFPKREALDDLKVLESL